MHLLKHLSRNDVCLLQSSAHLSQAQSQSLKYCLTEGGRLGCRLSRQHASLECRVAALAAAHIKRLDDEHGNMHLKCNHQNKSCTLTKGHRRPQSEREHREISSFTAAANIVTLD